MLYFLSLPAWAQFDKDFLGLSAEENLILKSITAYDVVKTDTTGRLTQIWLEIDSQLCSLSERMSAQKLLALTYHDKPIIRCRAFHVLVDEYEGDALSIIQEHMQDTAVVHSFPGSCLPMKAYVGDYFVEVYRRKCFFARDSIQRGKLDSIVIFAPNKLSARHFAMYRAANAGKFYNKIREIVMEAEVSGQGIITLAKFRREQDIDLIMNWKSSDHLHRDRNASCTFFAIAEFPHPAFSPFLQQYIKKAILAKPDVSCHLLYFAIANYNNKTSHDLLSLPFQIADKSIRTEHLEKLSEALKMNSNPIYNDLRSRLKGYK
ncbi:hypothetical protein [Ohtaekwangia koreensis]|uniref:hypothetical protein n=1 Tax=Ohtaekwangia koreensis TaxID=688867 RepID=UPI001180AF18|nr:hypothetical protein [Ohtaekwangia koreensis]